MSPEMRQSAEVLFARDVARFVQTQLLSSGVTGCGLVVPNEFSQNNILLSIYQNTSSDDHIICTCCRACRTGNFIAFFRLARKASYLQACLMHAHFSKVWYSLARSNAVLVIRHLS